MPKRIQESESEGSDGSSDESLDLNDSDGDSDSGGGSIDSEPPSNKKARTEPAKAPAKAPAAQKEVKSPATKLTSPPKSSAKSTASAQPSKATSSVPATSVPTSSGASTSTTQAPTNSSGDITRGPPITTDIAAKKLIGQYLTQQNRPYSAIQVHDNLHKRVPKATVERVLTSMSLPDSGFICKEYGKAKIYFVDQNTLPSNFTPQQLDQISAENDALKTENEARSAEERRVRSELQQLLNEPRDADLEEMIRLGREKVEEKRARVARLASGIQSCCCALYCLLTVQHTHYLSSEVFCHACFILHYPLPLLQATPPAPPPVLVPVNVRTARWRRPPRRTISSGGPGRPAKCSAWMLWTC